MNNVYENYLLDLGTLVLETALDAKERQIDEPSEYK